MSGAVIAPHLNSTSPIRDWILHFAYLQPKARDIGVIDSWSKCPRCGLEFCVVLSSDGAAKRCQCQNCYIIFEARPIERLIAA